MVGPCSLRSASPGSPYSVIGQLMPHSNLCLCHHVTASLCFSKLSSSACPFRDSCHQMKLVLILHLIHREPFLYRGWGETWTNLGVQFSTLLWEPPFCSGMSSSSHLPRQTFLSSFKVMARHYRTRGSRGPCPLSGLRFWGSFPL